MKKYLSAITALFLIGCVSVPVDQTFPGVPAVLQETPPALKEVPENATADQVFGVVIDNYSTYHEVAAKLLGWQQWYQAQKKIFDNTHWVDKVI